MGQLMKNLARSITPRATVFSQCVRIFQLWMCKDYLVYVGVSFLCSSLKVCARKTISTISSVLERINIKTLQ